MKKYLTVSIIRNRLKVAKYIIDNFNININKKYQFGYTVLMQASTNTVYRKGIIETVKFLLSLKEIDLNEKNDYGETALYRSTKIMLYGAKEFENRDSIPKLLITSGKIDEEDAKNVLLMLYSYLSNNIKPERRKLAKSVWLDLSKGSNLSNFEYLPSLKDILNFKY